MSTELQTIKINDKFYDVAQLTEKAANLLNDIKTIDVETNRLNTQAAINKIARDTLVNVLAEEAVNLVEVEAPAEATAE